MNLTQKQLFIIAGGAVALLLIGYFSYINLRSNSEPQPVALTLWGTEPKASMEAMIGMYNRIRPNVTITYEQKDPVRYETELLDALAAGAGPDLITVRNGSVSRMQNKIVPAPEERFLAAAVGDFFPLVVSQDFVRDGRVYALPFYLDTLALFYNKELFDQSGLVSPPKTWEEFRSDVARLRVTSDDGRVERAGAALGSTDTSVVRGSDIVLSLMLQNGVQMLDSNGAPAFASEEGENAFTFYLQFANSNSSYYTWNDDMGNSLARFAAGDVAMAFGYASDYEDMKQKNPYLRAGIAGIPQVDPKQARTIGRYEGFAVTKRSKEPLWAWDFIIISTTYPEVMAAYSEASKRPVALKSLIGNQAGETTEAVFARQALTARSWFIPDDAQAGTIWSGMIREALGGKQPAQVLRDAQERMAALYQ
jgi:ABC-type glycerol-3-phosphate transport system substrate-binding protein